MLRDYGARVGFYKGSVRVWGSGFGASLNLGEPTDLFFRAPSYAFLALKPFGEERILREKVRHSVGIRDPPNNYKGSSFDPPKKLDE